jgi:hypothetical protein
MKTIKLLSALFLVTCLFSMCKKDSKTGDKSNSEYYIKGTIAGKAINWQATNTGVGWAAGSWSVLPNDQGNISGGMAALFTNYPGGTQHFAIEFKTIVKHLDDDATAVFKDFVKPGAWTYANDQDYVIGTKSVVVYYTDSSGKEYWSIGAQSNAALILSRPRMPTVILIILLQACTFNLC